MLKNTTTVGLLSASSNIVYLRSVRLHKPKNSLNTHNLISKDVQQQDNKTLIRDALETLVLLEASGSFLRVRFSWHVPTYLPQRADPPRNSICEKVAFNFSWMRENEEGSVLRGKCALIKGTWHVNSDLYGCAVQARGLSGAGIHHYWHLYLITTGTVTLS